MIEFGGDLSYLLNEKMEPEDMAYLHAMDISGTVYTRMSELGINKSELARMLGVTPARVTRMLKGEQSMTLKTLAKLECTLDIDMSDGFRHPRAFRDASPGLKSITLSSAGATDLVSDFAPPEEPIKELQYDTRTAFDNETIRDYSNNRQRYIRIAA